jgi:hypothetical protein
LEVGTGEEVPVFDSALWQAVKGMDKRRAERMIRFIKGSDSLPIKRFGMIPGRQLIYIPNG